MKKGERESVVDRFSGRRQGLSVRNIVGTAAFYFYSSHDYLMTNLIQYPSAEYCVCVSDQCIQPVNPLNV